MDHNNNQEELSLDSKIEGFLFWKGESIKIRELKEVFEKDESEILSALESLKKSLSGRGLKLIQTEDSVALVTDNTLGSLIEKHSNEELNKDLSKSSLETLTIILYCGPIHRSSIDFIRGVNSQFSIRSLISRGLVEKKSDPNDSKRFVYTPTIGLLEHLGITSVSELPEYDTVKRDIQLILEKNEDEESQFNTTHTDNS